MLNVALTGNVASGKSTVAAWFAEWGATVIDADQLVREVQQPGSPVLRAIVERFGTQILLPSGELDRAALRRLVFADPSARDALNAIVHPAVRARRDGLAQQAAARGDRILIHDIPLLFEAADPAAFDLVVLVDAPEDVRRRRLVDQRGLTTQEADAMLRAQMPSGQKRRHSDMVLDNTGSLAQLRAAAEQAWGKIRLLDTPPGPE
ncbi:MAG TPA: dephospho-CoA kinase [Gemmatimonadales bacterium]